MAEGTVVILSNESGLAQEIASRNQRWRADEPVPLGTDLGPSPYELPLSSLGACLYAQRKGMDIQRVTVRLQHFRVHAEDCEGSAVLLMEQIVSRGQCPAL